MAADNPFARNPVIPTPEETEELVDHFGSQRAAARAVGVHRSTVGHWLNPEPKRVHDRDYMRKRREDPEFLERQAAYERERYESMSGMGTTGCSCVSGGAPA